MSWTTEEEKIIKNSNLHNHHLHTLDLLVLLPGEHVVGAHDQCVVHSTERHIKTDQLKINS